MSYGYFVLMRHGEGFRRNRKPGPVNWLSNDGYEEVTDIAYYLVKTLEEIPEEYKFSIGKIIFMPTRGNDYCLWRGTTFAAIPGACTMTAQAIDSSF